MAFTKSDRSEVESLLSKTTTTQDGIGRTKRDIQLVVKLNPHWPSSVRNALNSYALECGNILGYFVPLEANVISAINEELPPE